NRHAPAKRRMSRCCSPVGISSYLKAWNRCMNKSYQLARVVKDAYGVRAIHPRHERGRRKTFLLCVLVKSEPGCNCVGANPNISAESVPKRVQPRGGRAEPRK